MTGTHERKMSAKAWKRRVIVAVADEALKILITLGALVGSLWLAEMIVRAAEGLIA